MKQTCEGGFDPKALATLQARAALSGVQILESVSAGTPVLVATRWGYAKDFATIAAASQWLDRVAGVKR